jgi:bilin biosynthesis protein
MTQPAIELTPAQIATDELLRTVNKAMAMHEFDDNDTVVLQRIITEGLSDTRGVIRLRAAETLGEIGEAATPQLIEALLHNPNVTIRRAAAKTIALIEDPSAVPALLHAFLHDEDTVVHGSSVGALARIGEVSVPALLEIIADPQNPETTKGHAAWALSFVGAEAADYLYPALDHESIDVRCAVISAISHVAQEKGDLRACEILVTALQDPSEVLRCEAAAALGQVNYPLAIEPLTTSMEDPSLDVRKAAVSSLGKIGDERSIEPLTAAMNDPLPVIRVLAKVALQQLQSKLQEDFV